MSLLFFQSQDQIPMDYWMVYACGLHALGFAFFHSRFWKIFRWNTDLEKVLPANKVIMQILNGQIIFLFILVALICFLFPKALLTTSLGKFFMCGMSLFWFVRTIQQIVYVKIEHRLVHLLTYLFILGVMMWAIPVLL